uniref:Uncharacterized protein n=1 Tax=Anguilla anguilla TaxID=7936 RepID=A0A0E9W349_ANGAN
MALHCKQLNTKCTIVHKVKFFDLFLCQRQTKEIG